MKSRILALFCLLAILATLTLTSCGKDAVEVEMIDLNGYTQSDVIDWSAANRIADKINYQFEYSDTVPDGYFLRASLTPGVMITEPVDVVISLGKSGVDSSYYPIGSEMPNVIGLRLNEALKIIGEQCPGRKVTVTRSASEAKIDTVIYSFPLPEKGLFLTDESDIILTVSDGPEKEKKNVDITVPFLFVQGTIIKVYVNNVLQQTITEFEDESVAQYTVTVTGTGTDVPVRIEVGGRAIYSTGIVHRYRVDFELGIAFPDFKE